MLSLYYLCDQAAALRALSADEMARCMVHYERLKLEFVDEVPAPQGSRARAAQSRMGYRGFKMWEEANGDLADKMCADARRRLADM